MKEKMQLLEKPDGNVWACWLKRMLSLPKEFHDHVISRDALVKTSLYDLRPFTCARYGY